MVGFAVWPVFLDERHGFCSEILTLKTDEGSFSFYLYRVVFVLRWVATSPAVFYNNLKIRLLRTNAARSLVCVISSTGVGAGGWEKFENLTNTKLISKAVLFERRLMLTQNLFASILWRQIASEAIFGVLNKGLNVSLSIKKIQPARDLKLISLLQSSLFLGPLSSRQGKEERVWKPGCLSL